MRQNASIFYVDESVLYCIQCHKSEQQHASTSAKIDTCMAIMYVDTTIKDKELRQVRMEKWFLTITEESWLLSLFKNQVCTITTALKLQLGDASFTRAYQAPKTKVWRSYKDR